MNDFALLLDRMERDYEKAFCCLSWRIMKELESCCELRALSLDSSEPMATFIEEIWDRNVPFTYQTAINRIRFFQAAADAMHVSAFHIEHERNKKMRSRLRKMGYKQMPILPIEEEDISRFMTEAIVRYEKQDRAKADLQKLKFYLGMTMAEVANLLGRPEDEVTADWSLAINELAKLMKEVAEEGEKPLKKPNRKKRMKRRF